jgi:lipopolysaccharide export LptBFGC system permease protein LptF
VLVLFSEHDISLNDIMQPVFVMDIVVAVVVVVLQAFVGPWPLVQFLDPIHIR